jgi:hypothetical protein
MHPPEPAALGYVNDKEDGGSQESKSELSEQDEIGAREIHAASNHGANSAPAEKHLRDGQHEESQL